MSEEQNKLMPPPPDANIDQDRVDGAAQRWENCPLRDCKRNTDLLYEDFYLRDIRTDRLMCSACAVRTEIGYLAREVVRASDDRFFQGTTVDYAIVFGVTTLGSMIVNSAILLIPFLGFWFIAAAIGGGAGMVIGRTARRITGGRVGRQSAYVATGGVVAGLLLSPFIWVFLVSGFIGIQGLLTNPEIVGSLAFGNFGTLLCTFFMGMSIWSVFSRRI